MTLVRLRARALLVFAVILIAACSSKPSPPEPQPQIPTTPPQKAAPEVRAQLHTELAAGYYERGQMAVALEEVNQATKIDPDYARAYNIAGLVYAYLGDDRKAQASFNQALQLAPNDSDIRHNWGWYLCTHDRQRESLAEFDRAVNNPLYRTPEVAMVNAGRCAQAINDDAAAENYFRHALAIQPGNPLASLGLAQLAYKARRYDEARSWMKGVMLMTNPPPEALRVGVCIERKLGDRQAELSYISQLTNRYPDAPETKAIATESCE
jgi:type IV pilus assembly protein PilF